MRTLCKKFLPSMKAAHPFATNSAKATLNLAHRILEMALYITLHNAIGPKSLTNSGVAFFGIKVSVVVNLLQDLTRDKEFSHYTYHIIFTNQLSFFKELIGKAIRAYAFGTRYTPQGYLYLVNSHWTYKLDSIFLRKHWSHSYNYGVNH